MIDNLKELWQYKYLVHTFVMRDIKARYKQTSIGILWAVIQPMFLMFIFTLVFSYFFKVDTGGKPYPIFSYVALLPWMFISRVLTASGNQFLSSQGLITRVYFPREIIPLSATLSALVDFAFGSLVFILMLFYYHIPLTPTFLFVLIILPIQVLLATGLSLFSSAMVSLFRDFEFALPLLTQLWMYASPIIYSVHNLQPRFQSFFYLNPVTGIVDGYRSSILNGQVPDLGYLGSSALISLLLTITAYWLFKKVEYFIVDIL